MGFGNKGRPQRSIFTARTKNPGPFQPFAFNHRGQAVDPSTHGALVSPQGFLTIRLNQGIKVDITLNKAIRIQNNPASVIMSLNSDGCTSALIHPSGRVYQYGSRVEITVKDQQGANKFAKMSHKGISFSTERGGLIYLVDAAGCRSTTDVFSDMTGDFSMPVFLTDSAVGAEMMDECMSVLHASKYWLTDDGVENWILNGIRVSQTADGMVRVGRGSSKYQFRTSPLNGTASLTTPYVHITASIGNACHLFVKRGERRMHYDGLSFIVRNAGHSAGLDEANQLKVF